MFEPQRFVNGVLCEQTWNWIWDGGSVGGIFAFGICRHFMLDKFDIALQLKETLKYDISLLKKTINYVLYYYIAYTFPFAN